VVPSDIALFFFDGHFGRLNDRKNLITSFRFIRWTELVVITDVTSPAAVRMTISETTLSETIFSMVPGNRFRMLLLMTRSVLDLAEF
jgi:hypothetical protein